MIYWDNHHVADGSVESVIYRNYSLKKILQLVQDIHFLRMTFSALRMALISSGWFRLSLDGSALLKAAFT